MTAHRLRERNACPLDGAKSDSLLVLEIAPAVGCQHAYEQCPCGAAGLETAAVWIHLQAENLQSFDAEQRLATG